MKTEANIILDSYINNVRVTTFELILPRIILSEFNTHRRFSRNASSSRATPFNRILKSVTFRPSVWRINGKGMQPKKDAGLIRSILASIVWEVARFSAITFSFVFNKILKIHKELSNRLLEPFQFTKVVVTSTEWQNFLTLRTHETAQLEIRELAMKMAEELERSVPSNRIMHLPYVTQKEIDSAFTLSRQGNLKAMFELVMSSVARCARVSYLNFDGSVDIKKDIELFKSLAVSKPSHNSPAEHQVLNAAFAFEVLIDVNDYIEDQEDLNGNLDPRIIQFRKLMERKNFLFMERYLKML